MTKQPVWIVENPTYHYDNFKDQIEYSGWDVYSFYNGNKNNLKSIGFFDMDKNPVDPETLKEKYSVIIKTGSARFPRHLDVLGITTTRKCIQVAHSIIGATVDLAASMPLGNQKTNYGLFPEVWLNASLTNERYQKLVAKGKTENALPVKTHPYMAKVIEPLHHIQEPNTLGLLLANGQGSGAGSFTNKIIQGLEKRNAHFDKIYVKRHPLQQTSSGAVFKELKKYTDELIVIQANEDKNGFIDRCETIVTGMSSMFAEASLRGKFHKTNKQVFAVNDVVGVGVPPKVYAEDGSYTFDRSKTDFHFADTGITYTDWSTGVPYEDWTQYDGLLDICTAPTIFQEFVDSVNETITVINTHVAAQKAKEEIVEAKREKAAQKKLENKLKKGKN